jgi:AcrR family transcriptional regulator
MPTKSIARPLRKDAAENRARLLHAASQVFAQLGLEASVEEVARVAGVGMGTLYRRFPTKEALIAELVLELRQEVLQDARRALQTPDGRGLEVFLHSAADRQVRNCGCLPRLWNTAETEQTDEVARQIRALIAELTRDAQEHGRLRTDVTPADIVVVLWSLRGVIESTLAVAPDAWRRHLAIVLAGLRPTPEELPDRPLSERQLQLIREADQHPRR